MQNNYSKEGFAFLALMSTLIVGITLLALWLAR